MSFPIKGSFTEDQIKYLDAVSQDSVNNQKRKSQVLDKDAFLKLMLTQLQHQNPLEPLDNSEQIAQMAQFSSVEQLANIATYQEQSLQMNALISAQLDELKEVIAPSEEDGEAGEDGEDKVGTDQMILEELVKLNKMLETYFAGDGDKGDVEAAMKALLSS
ncbi:flagellar hook assembly protein FlgD [Fusibacter sp. JL298sf-3]